MRPKSAHASRFLASVALVGVLALPVAGCKTTGDSDVTGSIGATSGGDLRRDVDRWGARYRDNSNDPDIAINYAQALRATDQRAQAVAVLEQVALRHPQNKALLGAYGRALADAGRFEQALDVLSRAHTPDQPDWRILSAQGAVLDQLGRHQDAQRQYASALKMQPNDPSVLSNLGLSYALSKDLTRAEATLRRAVAQPGADAKARQNLALVLGLQGRFTEAEAIARADLPPDQAAENVAALRQMVAEHRDRTDARSSRPVRAPVRNGRDG
ncbi:MAG: tetratricopeptide repeat protein [Pseudolabrys sp.]|nr:tetratricopeptide repeat protein [Pseudolabrys sp.]MCW5686550.1 tetratricopeptide repeat protein [Pseudolabrys sp.]